MEEVVGVEWLRGVKKSLPTSLALRLLALGVVARVAEAGVVVVPAVMVVAEGEPPVNAMPALAATPAAAARGEMGVGVLEVVVAGDGSGALIVALAMLGMLSSESAGTAANEDELSVVVLLAVAVVGSGSGNGGLLPSVVGLLFVELAAA